MVEWKKIHMQRQWRSQLKFRAWARSKCCQINLFLPKQNSTLVADGAIEQGYGSKRGSIPEGRQEVASLVVIVLHMHYDSELGDEGHPARALGLRGRPCRQCVTSLADDECVNTARPFLPRRICDHR